MCLRLAAESRVISAVTCQAESLPKNPPCPESSFLSVAETLRIRLPKILHEPPQKELFLGTEYRRFARLNQFAFDRSETSRMVVPPPERGQSFLGWPNLVERIAFE
jgi:hypothetical protein